MPPFLAPFADPDLLAQFLIEGRELVQQAGENLLALERSSGGAPAAHAAAVDAAFRAFHTLKGSAALFDMAPLRDMLHAAEDAMGALRRDPAPAPRPLVDALLACLGPCGSWLDAVERSGTLPAGAPAEAAARMAALAAALPAAADPRPQGTAPAPDRAWVDRLVAAVGPEAVDRARAAGRAVTAIRYRPQADCFFLGDDPLALARAVPGLLGLRLEVPRHVAAGPYDPFTCTTTILALGTAARDDLDRLFRFVADQVEVVEVPAPAGGGAAPAAMPAAGGARTMRIDPAHAEAVLALAGQLVIASSGLAQALRAGGLDAGGTARALHDRQAELERLTGALHGAALRLRLTPLATTFRRLPLLVRDTAARLGKQVAFAIEGEEVELDKTVVEALYEPLLHSLRNAIDHGIEAPAARAAAGKPAEGRITLRARAGSEAVTVTVADDGAGIDPARLRAAAAERRLGAPEALAALDEAATLDLVFAPGLSTARAVTEVSGRGVGMDAVRAAVTTMGGTVRVASRPGTGTSIVFTLPRATALASVLTVRAGGGTFGLALEAVAEVIRLPPDAIVRTPQGEATELRGRTLRLLRLGERLGERLGAAAPPPVPPRHRTVVVARGDGREACGFEVEGLGQRLDLLVHPPEGPLRGTPGLLGSGVTATGEVLLVLDLGGLGPWA